MFTVNSLHISWDLNATSLYASLHFQTCSILQLCLLNLQGLVISLHMSFLQLND